MPARWMLVTGLAACAGCGDNDLGVPRATLVADLAEDDAMALCAEFVSLICADVRGAEFCNACVVYDLCTRPELFSTMDVQCEDVTVGEVRDCAYRRVEELCYTNEGGCLFRVGAWLCHPESVL